MPETSIGPYIHKPLDIRGNLSFEVALDFMVALNDLPQAGDFVLGQVFDPDIRTYLGLSQNLLGRGTTNTIDIGQGHL